jgi:hypothetical protein
LDSETDLLQRAIGKLHNAIISTYVGAHQQ